jgi:hypothetical protein
LEHPAGQAAQAAMGNLLLQGGRLAEAAAHLNMARQGYLTLSQPEQVAEVDELLQIAHEAQARVGAMEILP